MRKQTKKILSIVMSAAMALSLGAGVDMTKATAADKLTDIESIEYNLTVSNVAEAGEVKVTATDGAWANPEKTISVDKDGDYTVKIEGLSKTLKNVGFFSSKTKMNINVTSIVVNGKYKMTMDTVGEINPTAIDPTSQTLNGLANIWNDAGKAKVVAKGDEAYLSYDADSDSIVMYVGETTAAPADPTTAPADPTAAPGAPSAIELKGTAGIDCSADGWRANENSKWEDATINGAGTYSVVTTFDEPVEVGDYMAVRIKDLDTVASYITFSDVSVWIDGKSVDMPLHYGGDKDCRIELVNNWGKTPTPACLDGVEFTQVKVQFTIGTRETARDWEVEANDDTLMPIVISDDYEYSYVDPNAPVVTPDPQAPVVTKNPAKSVKAAKKSVSVKKGKKVNVTFKVKATDNKKKTTDKVKATSSNKKVAKVVKTTVKPGKVVVSVKGVKKGSAKITLKVGSKKATVKVKVKK